MPSLSEILHFHFKSLFILLMSACVIFGSPGLFGMNTFLPPMYLTNSLTDLGLPEPTLKILFLIFVFIDK